MKYGPISRLCTICKAIRPVGMFVNLLGGVCETSVERSVQEMLQCGFPRALLHSIVNAVYAKIIIVVLAISGAVERNSLIHIERSRNSFSDVAMYERRRSVRYIQIRYKLREIGYEISLFISCIN